MEMTALQRGWGSDRDDSKYRKQFKLAMELKDELGLTDEERHELALMIPGVDKDGNGSWKNLTNEQMHTLLNYLEGALYVAHLRMQRGDNGNYDFDEEYGFK